MKIASLSFEWYDDTTAEIVPRIEFTQKASITNGIFYADFINQMRNSAMEKSVSFSVRGSRFHCLVSQTWNYALPLTHSLTHSILAPGLMIF